MNYSNTYRNLLIVLFALSFALMIQAQPAQRSATLTVIADGVTLQRAGTDMNFALRVGAVMPVGAGDIIHTGENGRVIIALSAENRLLLLPQTRYELREFSVTQADEYTVDSLMQGIAIHHFAETALSQWDYRMETAALTVTRPSNLFAVWAVEDRFEVAISAEGELGIQTPDSPDTLSMNSAEGIAVNYREAPAALVPPFHAAQLLAQVIDCNGVITTNGSAGLRLRLGPALDYLVVRVLQDNEAVQVVGTTENDLWFSIPYQTGFGWLFADLVETDCENLPRYPNLVGNVNEQIVDVTEAELEFLLPFYGDPRENRIFYR